MGGHQAEYKQPTCCDVPWCLQPTCVSLRGGDPTDLVPSPPWACECRASVKHPVPLPRLETRSKEFNTCARLPVRGNPGFGSTQPSSRS